MIVGCFEMALRLPYFFMNLYCALSGGHREVKFFIYEYISSTSQILVAVKFIDFEYTIMYRRQTLELCKNYFALLK